MQHYPFIDGKVGTTAQAIHNISKTTDLKKLIDLIVLQNTLQRVYAPSEGVYWLRKGSKQPVSMKTDMDLDICKKEYSGGKSIRIACTAIDKSSLGMNNYMY